MRTADVSKFLLAVFERPYDDQYISYFLWLQYVSIKKNYTSPSNKSPEKPNQKWVQCCMKAPISQVLLQTSLLIVQFSKTYLKTWKDEFVPFV